MIYDAIYCEIPNNIACLKWMNDNLIECMARQDLPELQHPIVKLSSELSCFFPSWANEITIPNHISIKEIKGVINDHL